MAAPAGDTVQQVKDRLSILEVVQPYVKLTRAGKYWKGLSPFSKEKTPSFYVSPDRGSYYCFSTSQGGDHFTFIEKMEGVDFKGALKILAEKAGVEVQQLRPEDRQRSDARERLRAAMSAAERYYADLLTEGSSAFAYARDRGLSPDTIRAWGLGLAPDGWRGLLEALTGQGYSVKELAAAGLVKEADGKPGTWYDRFRNRLMFPIRDTAGRTVAFTGRALDKDEQAKYLNSPETELFRKSEILFGMDRAKDAIRARGFAILVEGQFDLVLLHQAGFQNTIALSGTALSTTHLGLIKRYADNLMLALDADRAGLAASARNAHAALSVGMRVKAVRLPEGKDPADVVLEGGQAAFAQLVKDSTSVVEFFLSVLAASEKDDFKLMRRVEETVLPLVAAVKSPLERTRYVEIVARALGVPPEAVKEAMPKAASPSAAPRQAPADSKDAAPRPSPEAPGLARHRNLLFAAIRAYPDTGLAERLMAGYCEVTSAPGFPIEALADLDERLLFEAEQAFGESPSDEAGDELLKTFGRIFLEEARRQANVRLRKAEANGDVRGAEAALVEVNELGRRIHALS